MKRKHQVKIMADENEFQSLRGLAKAHGVTVAEYMRSCALERHIEPVRIIPQINRQIYADLGSAAGNLQRLYTWSCTDKRLPPDFAQKLSEFLKQLKSELSETRSQLIGANKNDSAH